ncbi:hypothetical protein THASP1DRAFT_27396 [Thamnocephalis sphaerospora]|uniref:Uncharacterized protein n=1 Tax=Thamnocephalis sphaerospora TaxID=78915 RepID=A0A4P9XXM7_9FUNG|nr:hypothetical protein THASP1DRAFT_27396 [Thamnocephalis sphaerospora]|eukprot:RKP10802.1 hypothetical protein THASP1DRAFT_27396 [Thamnocephalis sphaerospora]
METEALAGAPASETEPAFHALLDQLQPWMDVAQLPTQRESLSAALVQLCTAQAELVPLVRTTLRDLAILPEVYLSVSDSEYEDELFALSAMFPSRLADAMNASSRREELKQLCTERLRDVLFASQMPAGHMHEFSWLRLVCVLRGLFQEQLLENEVKHLLDIAAHGWSESFENLAMCALILNAEQLVAIDENKCRQAYAWIKSAGRSGVAMALAARYTGASLDFVCGIVRKTLNLPVILEKKDFMAFGMLIGGGGGGGDMPFSPDDLRKLTIVVCKDANSESMMRADESILDTIEAGRLEDGAYAEAVDGVRAISSVPAFLPSLIENGDSSASVQALLAILLLLLVLEAAEKRRQFEALYDGVHLLEKVDAIRWLTAICREHERFGPAVPPFVALIFVYAPELTTISRILLAHDQAAWQSADGGKRTSVTDPRHGLLAFRSRVIHDLEGHPYLDASLLQIHLLYEPLLQQITDAGELEIYLQDLYLLLLRSQRAMRMLHALRADPDQASRNAPRTMDSFALLQEVCIVRACLDYAKNADTACHVPLFGFLNDFLVDRQAVLKVLHWQGYDADLIDLLIDRLPVMRRCYAFLADLLDRPDPTDEQRRFATRLATCLLRRMPPTKSTPVEIIQKRIADLQASPHTDAAKTKAMLPTNISIDVMDIS